jgi:hypothetical protein
MAELPAPRRRASRYIRTETPQSFRLTQRDIQIIQAVNNCRLLRQDQIQRLFFPSRNTAQVRLQLLWQHGFLKREFLPVISGIQTSPVIYAIDKRGARFLESEIGYEKSALRQSAQKPGFEFIEHTLGLSEIRIALMLSCRQHAGLELKTWLDEKAMKSNYDRAQVGNRMVAVLPDAYFVVSLAQGGSLHFFLEFDRGSEHLKFLSKKFAAYYAFFQSGKSKIRFGTDKVRVLVITAGRRSFGKRSRLESLKELTKSLPANRWFWFSNLDQISANDFMFDPIWLTTNQDDFRRIIG